MTRQPCFNEALSCIYLWEGEKAGEEVSFAGPTDLEEKSVFELETLARNAFKKVLFGPPCA